MTTFTFETQTGMMNGMKKEIEAGSMNEAIEQYALSAGSALLCGIQTSGKSWDTLEFRVNGWDMFTIMAGMDRGNPRVAVHPTGRQAEVVLDRVIDMSNYREGGSAKYLA